MSAGTAKPSILIASGPWAAAPWAETIRARDPDRPVHCWPDVSADFRPRYLLAWKPPAEAVAAARDVAVVFSLGAGVDHLVHLDLPEVPIVRIIDDDLTGRMTEWVTLQVLLHHRQQRAYDRLQAKAEWRELRQAPAGEVRVGIMGLGVLGRAAADALKHLGFAVAGWSRTPRPDAGIATFHGTDGLDAFLARTDILVCLLPLTPATEGLLDDALFRKLARDGPLGGPVLINAGRGGVQNEDDIARALTDGTLIGASLDVFCEEPLDPASPLWRLDNLVITPHVSAPSAPATLAAAIHAQIVDYEAGKPLRGVIDRTAWY